MNVSRASSESLSFVIGIDEETYRCFTVCDIVVETVYRTDNLATLFSHDYES